MELRTKLRIHKCATGRWLSGSRRRSCSRNGGAKHANAQYLHDTAFSRVVPQMGAQSRGAGRVWCGWLIGVRESRGDREDSRLFGFCTRLNRRLVEQVSHPPQHQQQHPSCSVNNRAPGHETQGRIRKDGQWLLCESKASSALVAQLLPLFGGSALAHFAIRK